MPRRKQATRPATSDRPTGIVWISQQPPQAVWDSLDESPPDSDAVADFILDAVERGWSFSLKYNDKVSAYVATIVAPLDDSTSSVGISGFSDQPSDALLSLYGKVVLWCHWDLNGLATNTDTKRSRFR
jgi:hypothetical protein